MKYSMIIVCPKCRKEVSEYALVCANCGCSLDPQSPLKVQSVVRKTNLKFRITKSIGWSLAILAVLELVSLFVFTQAMLAYNVWRCFSTIDGLLLFRNAVEQGSLYIIAKSALISAVIAIACIVIIVCLVIKILRNHKIKTVE